jgi:hypothetical protein
MFAFLLKLLLVTRSRLKSRATLEAENLVLRQRVIVLSRKSRSRVRLRNIDQLIFVWLYRCFRLSAGVYISGQRMRVIRFRTSSAASITAAKGRMKSHAPTPIGAVPKMKLPSCV